MTFELAELLHMTHAQLMREMTVRELCTWIAYCDQKRAQTQVSSARNGNP